MASEPLVSSQPVTPSAPRGQLLTAMLVMVVIWSANYTVAKIGLMHMRPLALASFRILTAGLVMAPVALYARRAWRKRAESGQASLFSRVSYRTHALFTFVFIGFFGVFLNQGLFTLGLGLTSVGHSSIIAATAPIFIVLAARARGMERLTGRKVLGLILGFGGAAVLGARRGWDLGSAEAQGDLLTLLAVFSVTIATVYAKRVAGSFDALRLSVSIVAFAGLFALPVAVWQGAEMTRAGEWALMGWQGWAAVAYMGLLSTALCIPLYFWVLRSIPASKIGALSYLQPVLGTPIAALVLGEPLTASLIAGGVLILLGVYSIESSASEEFAGSGRVKA